VTEGQTIAVERLDVEEGASVELDHVLLIGEGEDVTIGTPVVDGARVVATATENGRGDKIIVFKYKRKVRYRRKNGHRQLYTMLSIENILPPGAAAPKAKTARAKAAAKPAAAADTKPEAAAEAAPEAAAKETAPAAAAPKAAAKPKATTTAKAAPKAAAPRTAKPKATPKKTTAAKPKASAKTAAAKPKPARKAAPRKKKEETTDNGA
jgi:large subunit ribosomal protein L21